MAKWVAAAVLDGGLDYIAANCTSIRLISAYTAGDSYATVAANTLADVSVTSGNFTKAGAAGAPRTITNSSGLIDSSAQAGGGGATMHFAFCTAAAVLFVTEETSDQTITLGNPVTFPAITYTANQPA